MISPRCTTLGSATWELSSSSVMWSRQRSVFPGGTSVSKTLKSSVKLGVGPQLDSAATPRFVRRGGKSSELQWKRVLLPICLCHLWPITSQESCSCSAPFDLAWPPAPAAGVQTSRFAFKQTRREFIWYGGGKRRVKERNVVFLFCHIRHWHMYQLMTCGLTLWERAFLFSTTSERSCFIRLAASIQAVPLSRPVHSLLPEESSLVCVSLVCFVHFELIIIWLRLLARLSMFSFRLSRADDFCRWSWLCGRYSKDTSGGRPKAHRLGSDLPLFRLWSPGLTALRNTTTMSCVWTSRVRCAVRRYVTVHARGGEKKSFNCELTWLKFGVFFWGIWCK